MRRRVVIRPRGPDPGPARPAPGPVRVAGQACMRIPPETLDDLEVRLRRAEGQVRGVQRMLLDGAECRDVVTQLSAATHALEQVGFRLLAAEMTVCAGRPDGPAARATRLSELERLFTKLS
jgi:DNA-binding FrmR family transcriptional regulator